MSGLRSQPVSRAKVLLGALIACVVLAGVIGLAEWLRPGPSTVARDVPPGVDSDPRVEVVCEEPQAREGQRRDSAVRPTEALPVTSNNLYDCPTTWDGRRVRYIGELVGGILQRDTHAWIQLNDDLYAGEVGPLPAHNDFRGGNAGVGVRVPLDAVGPLEWVGGPRARGDTVQVIGTYHRVDEDTREVAVIVAEELQVIRSGARLPVPVEPRRVAVATGLGAVAAALLGAEWWQRRRTFRR